MHVMMQATTLNKQEKHDKVMQGAMEAEAHTGSRLLVRVPALRRVAPSHSRLATRKEESALLAASWHATWIRFQWDTVLYTCKVACHPHKEFACINAEVRVPVLELGIQYINSGVDQ